MRQRRPAPSRLIVCAAHAAIVSAAGAAALGAQTPNGVLGGMVVAAETHAPLAGARVALASPLRVATTDARGAYVLRRLPAGRYEL
ncbi:MAG: hypothetical protein HOQ15_07755, partial [Gemmatimonadaceae bacterium]|nr:hypothetical protein [Gemmatimonadaceae bacterium]